MPFPRGTYALDPDGTAEQRMPARGMPLLYVRESALGGAARRRRAARRVDLHRQLHLSVRQRHRESARPRSRPRDEYVLFSAHQDHDGERYTVNGDNIWNGADDNATTSVALLAIGRAMAASPGRRSALFIWHGAEERGLMGSRWYVEAPDRAAEVDRRRASTAT